MLDWVLLVSIFAFSVSSINFFCPSVLICCIFSSISTIVCLSFSISSFNFPSSIIESVLFCLRFVFSSFNVWTSFSSLCILAARQCFSSSLSSFFSFKYFNASFLSLSSCFSLSSSSSIIIFSFSIVS